MFLPDSTDVRWMLTSSPSLPFIALHYLTDVPLSVLSSLESHSLSVLMFQRPGRKVFPFSCLFVIGEEVHWEERESCKRDSEGKSLYSSPNEPLLSLPVYHCVSPVFFLSFERISCLPSLTHERYRRMKKRANSIIQRCIARVTASMMSWMKWLHTLKAGDYAVHFWRERWFFLLRTSDFVSSLCHTPHTHSRISNNS